MKKFLEKRIAVKSILILLTVCIMIPVAFICYQYLTSLSRTEVYEYVAENSEVNSQSFDFMKLTINNPGIDYYYAVSEDKSCNSELFLFDKRDTLLNKINLGSDRFAYPYVSVSTEKEVGSLQIYVPLECDDNHEDSYLVYYTNNKSRLRKCVYEYTLNGNSYSEEISIPIGSAYAFAIPLITNHEINRREIVKVSFYDEFKELAFEDIPQISLM